MSPVCCISPAWYLKKKHITVKLQHHFKIIGQQLTKF